MSRLAISPIRRAARKSHAAILGIGTASPTTIAQEQILQVAREMAGATPDQELWLKRVFLHSGIEKRGIVLVGDDPADLQPLRRFYPPPSSPADRGPTTAVRMARYAMDAPVLAHAAAIRALTDSQTASDQITHLITVSCTGFFAPGLDAALIGRLKLSPAVRRLHVGFMGCHAAFNALAAARDTVVADANARVLVCCVELCSLHFAYGWDPGKLVANALFADGSAAAVVGRPRADHPTMWHLRDTASFLLPDSLDAMTWRIGDHGFEMTLSQSVPTVIRANLLQWCQTWLAKHDLRISDIAGWAIHPGGPKILSAVADALELPHEVLNHSRHILANHGNMSSATVPFILHRMAQEITSGPCVAIGLGPGLMVEGMLLNR
jgi:prepilin-type processing-associated H-X9-DG protein